MAAAEGDDEGAKADSRQKTEDIKKTSEDLNLFLLFLLFGSSRIASFASRHGQSGKRFLVAFLVPRSAGVCRLCSVNLSKRSKITGCTGRGT